MTEKEMKLEKLYELLEDLEKANRTEEAGALKWAIFQIEYK